MPPSERNIRAILIYRVTFLAINLIYLVAVAGFDSAVAGLVAVVLLGYGVALRIWRNNPLALHLAVFPVNLAAISFGIWLTGGPSSSGYLLYLTETMAVTMFFGRRMVLFAPTFSILLYVAACYGSLTAATSPSFGYRVLLLYLLSVAISIHANAISEAASRLQREKEIGQRNLERLRTLGRLAGEVNAHLELSTILKTVIDSAVELVDADGGWVMLREADGLFRVQVVANLPQENVGKEADGRGVSSEVIRSGQVVIVHQGDASHQGIQDTLAEEGLDNALGVPIVSEKELVGVIGLTASAPRRFSADDVDLLESFAQQAATAITNGRLLAESRRRAMHLATLNEIGRSITSALKLDSLFGVIYHEISQVMDASGFFIALYDEGDSYVELAYLVDQGERYPPVRIPLNEGPTCQAIKERRVVRLTDTNCPGATWVGQDEQETQSGLVVPMIFEGRVLGAISAQSYLPGAYGNEHESLLITIASQAAVAIENAKLYQKTLEMSLTDYLTGLGNARYLFQELELELDRAKRYNHPVSLIMMDSDSLKGINDRFGHLAGDLHLISLGRVLKANIRSTDVPIRYAGDEFMIILPETDTESALALAERIRKEVAGQELEIQGQRIKASVSIGLATFPHHGDTVEELINQADTALYQSKRKGKNCVTVLDVAD
ncbi:MAG: diguanylate cyclase [Bacillota bacterium]